MKLRVGFLLLLCVGCALKPKAPAVHISLTDNNSAVKFSGLDQAITGEIGRDSTAGIWETLLPVYKMPGDTGLKNYQPVQHGKYQLKGGEIVFTPDTAFVKGQAYFMRYYRFGEGDIWDYIKGKKRLGAAPYTDVVIKF
jgi:hypothetical protein